MPIQNNSLNFSLVRAAEIEVTDVNASMLRISSDLVL
jgi:hypothetical protein